MNSTDGPNVYCRISVQEITWTNSGTNVRIARWRIFKPKILICVKFWRVLQWKMHVYFVAILYILGIFCIFLGYFVYFRDILYILGKFCIF
jgi:hypothetical protein